MTQIKKALYMLNLNVYKYILAQNEYHIYRQTPLHNHD